MITIVDYGMGNLGSVKNMLKRIGVASQIASDMATIEAAQKIILPGVGAFDAAIERIDTLGLRSLLTYKANEQKVPFLGICLGMQLLTTSSEEGTLPGLNLIPATTKKFEVDSQNLKVPHMGWNRLTLQGNSGLTSQFDAGFKFYFVHSYYVRVNHEENSVAKTTYGIEFDSMIAHNNIYGAQFHPEKSHKFGMKLFENFAAL